MEFIIKRLLESKRSGILSSEIFDYSNKEFDQLVFVIGDTIMDVVSKYGEIEIDDERFIGKAGDNSLVYKAGLYYYKGEGRVSDISARHWKKIKSELSSLLSFDSSSDSEYTYEVEIDLEYRELTIRFSRWKNLSW